MSCSSFFSTRPILKSFFFLTCLSTFFVEEYNNKLEKKDPNAMALSAETRQAILAESDQYTYAELAAKHGCSKSTVQRLVSKAQSSNVPPAGGDASASTSADSNGFVSDQHTTITPSADDDLQQIEIQQDEALTGLLNSLQNEDAPNADAGGAPSAEAVAMDEAVGELSVDHATKIAASFGVTADDKPPPRPKARRRSAAAAPSRVRALAPAPAPAPASAPDAQPQELPLPLARTQLSLFLSSFKAELIAGGYAPSAQDIEAQVARTSRMTRQEVRDTLASVRGVLTLETSVSSVVNGCLMGASVGANLGPMAGLQLQGLDRMLMEQKAELQACAKLYVLDEWDYFQDRVNGKSKLAMTVLSAAMQCHNANCIAQRTRARAEASDELLRTLDGR
jgi:transposase-like protein